MKIALAIEKFSKHAGGAESYAVDLAETLVKRGWEVHLYGYEWDGFPSQAIFHELKRPPLCFSRSMKLLHFAFTHRDQTQRIDFNVVLGFGSTIYMNVYQSHGGVHKLSSSRKLLAIRNPLVRFLKKILMLSSPKYHVRSWIESAPFRLNPRPKIVAISEMIKDDMADVYKIDPNEITVIYNGVDTQRFSRNPNSRGASDLRKSLGFNDEVLFLFMSYDFRKKGARFLIEAAHRLRQTATEKFGVVLVGRPPSPVIARLVDKFGLKDVIRFPGPTKDPQLFYSACDVFVLPTFYDACSLVVFEAMSCGMPVITSAYNGASGIIEHGLDGFVIQNPSDSFEICSYMNRLLDRGFLEEVSKRAFDKSQNFSLEANHSQMVRVFMEAASEDMGN
ncbi:MAG: glycosyltransferase family 4 protein [Desulfomonilaceae bacterium]